MASTTAARLIFSYIGNRAFPPSKFFTRKLFFPNSSTLHFHRYSHSSSAATAAVNDTPGVNSHHPWPEWVCFVDYLNAKGYFSTRYIGIDYKDKNLTRDACLNFARDRSDIFKSLSIQDIQAVVKRGCPNVSRKSVNSGKRLRVYLQLDEGDVCSSCLLRESCDSANVILKVSEAAARTVDIVRILRAYALDSPVITGGEKPPSREHIEVSARKLLLELIELSEKAPTPKIPKPIAKAPKQNEKFLRLVDDKPNRGYSMHPKNRRCLKIKAEGPRRVGCPDFEKKKADWNCARCRFLNYGRNAICLKCFADPPNEKLDPRYVY